MGLFSAIQQIGLVVGSVKDMITTGIASAKLTGKMQELAEKAQNEYKAQFTPADSAFSLKYRKAKEKVDSLEATKENQDENMKLTENMEDKLAVFLKSLSKNTALPQDFREKCGKLSQEYTDTKDAAIEAFEKRCMKLAKSDEEKEAVAQIFDEAKKDYK